MHCGRVVDLQRGCASVLHALDATPLAESARILAPAQTVARTTDDSGLRSHFEAVLETSLAALGVREEDGVGTIHLYNPGTNSLILKASVGHLDDAENATVQKVADGDGVIAWVFRRSRSVVIRRLGDSAFGSIHVSIRNNTQSELAVPMIADGRVIGVLNLESVRPDAFSPQSVRSIWYAANSAATAYHISRQATLNAELFRIWSEAEKPKEGAFDAQKGAANRLARLLGDAKEATSCEIWLDDQDSKQFSLFGSSPAEYHSVVIRRDGWSAYVKKHKSVVWIRRLEGSTFESRMWRDGKWEGSLADAPKTLNASFDVDVRAALAFPIGANFKGVLWLRFNHDFAAPNETEVQEAEAFVSQAALILEAAENREWKLSRLTVEELKGHPELLHPFVSEVLKPNIFEREGPKQPKRERLFSLEGYVLHKGAGPHLSGDFHCSKRINDSAFGLLLGDGCGHALHGFIHALPLISLFEHMAVRSMSPRHVMDEMTRAARRTGVRGDAVYSIFIEIHKRLFLRTVKAGANCGLVLCQQNMIGPFPPTSHSSMTLGEIGDSPMEEAGTELFEGDTIVGFTDGVTECNLTWQDIMTMAGPLSDSCQQIAERAVAGIEGKQKRTCPDMEADDLSLFVVKVKGFDKALAQSDATTRESAPTPAAPHSPERR
ncbi:MAG: GAF domain-containing protein [Acidobacteria bacterium]|nr:GAF domain-containing protein [Acidobacteriota bacterium]